MSELNYELISQEVIQRNITTRYTILYKGKEYEFDKWQTDDSETCNYDNDYYFVGDSEKRVKELSDDDQDELYEIICDVN